MGKTLVEPSGCWKWTGAIGSHGRYGIVGLVGKQWLAHRASWFLFRGEDPGGRAVCHRCDNGLCVNPDHLFLGTQGDNVTDMERKGRSNHPRHEAHGRAKLTAADVLSIRARVNSGESIRKVAKSYAHVHRQTVRSAARGETWQFTT